MKVELGDIVLVNTLGRIGTVIDRPWWYGGAKHWDHYIEIEPGLVTGVMEGELQPPGFQNEIPKEG